MPRYARYVVDVNRPPENAPMYPGVNNTELCPTRFFSGDALYRDGMAPDAAEAMAGLGGKGAKGWETVGGVAGGVIKLIVEGCGVSAVAKEKIEKAGGQAILL